MNWSQWSQNGGGAGPADVRKAMRSFRGLLEMPSVLLSCGHQGDLLVHQFIELYLRPTVHFVHITLSFFRSHLKTERK